MSELDLSVPFDFICDACGADLEASQPDSTTIKVKPCTDCMDQAYEEGREAGHAEGKEEGYAEAKNPRDED